MLSRLALAALALSAPAGAAHSGAQLAIGAVVVKRAQVSVQGHRLEVRSNSREGVRLSFSPGPTIIVPGGVQILDLRELGLPPGGPLQITASPL